MSYMKDRQLFWKPHRLFYKEGGLFSEKINTFGTLKTILISLLPYDNGKYNKKNEARLSGFG